MMRIVFIFFFTLSFIAKVQSQNAIPVVINKNEGKKIFLSKAFLAEGYHENRNLKYKGEFIKCTTRDPLGFYDIYESRKIGRWIYYHANGNIERIENYSHHTSCGERNFKSGIWQYWNDRGELYFEEEYQQDTLMASVVDIFNKNQLIGKIITRNGTIDSVDFIRNVASKNLIPNSDFEDYKYKPVEIVNSGQNNIEDLIPEWDSPDGNTPDYYNYNRSVKGIYNVVDSEPIQNGFVGLVLFHDESDRYLEHIQVRLTEKLDSGLLYCYKMKIRLSQNAGYSIDRFGVRLLRDKADDRVEKNQDQFAKIDFHEQLDNTQEWASLCHLFVAKGGEQFLVLGRFATRDEINLERIVPKYNNKLDINKSAYYLVDDLQLFSVSSENECGCKQDSLLPTISPPLDDMVFSDFIEMKNGERLTLSNIQFETNSAELLNSSFSELEKLKSFLSTDLSINIMILGHTDAIGNENYNVKLSEQRAEAVKDWLIENGISRDRLQYTGLGFSEPLVDNSTEENRQLNRRVEIVVVK